MLVHVAVADAAAPHAKSVTGMLNSRGFSARAPADLDAWVRAEQVKVVLLTVATEQDWESLGRLRSIDEQLLILAVMDPVDQTSYLRALSAGAVGVLPRDASAKAVVHAVGSLARGESVVPLTVIRALVRKGSRSEGGDSADVTLSPAELGWLRQLADGKTVRHLANDVGYSERMMFRMLNGLYARLGVRTRTEALFLARGRDWI